MLSCALAALAVTISDPTSAAPRHHGRVAKSSVPATRSRAGSLPPREAHTPAPQRVKPESIGSPNEGRLEGGVHADLTHPYLRVVPAYVPGDYRWGLPTMIAMIDRAAKAVNKRYPGSTLDLGDLSKKGGGDLLRHHSHESGRDADLGFYSVDAHGKQVHAHQFIRFDGSLDSTNVPGAHFDLARNWLLVQELVTDPQARVSHIFIAEPLKERLIAYARSHGVSRAILDRVAMVMMQPHHSLPHDDHFHVRISCPASMRGTCIELAKGALASHDKRIAKHGHGAKVTPVAHGHHQPAPIHTKPMAPKPDAPPMMKFEPMEDNESDPAANEAESDATDAKGAVDDSGTPRITD